MSSELVSRSLMPYYVFGAVVPLFGILWFWAAPLSHRRVRLLLRDSHILYAKKQYAESLDVALAAQRLACSLFGELSPLYVRTLVHLAAVHSAMSEFEKALRTLDEAEALVQRANGLECLQLVPVLHARAGVLETSGQTHLAIEQLNRVREIHRTKLTARRLEYGYSCYNQAAAIVRHANDAPDMVPSQRAELVERAVLLILEASDAADAAFDAHQGFEFAEEILKLVVSGGSPNRLATLPECEASIQKLRAHLTEHFEYFGGDDTLSTDNLSDSQTVCKDGNAE